MSQHPATRCHTPPSIMCLRLRFLSRDTRPDRDETQQAGRTGATPLCRGLLVMGSGPGGAPAHPRLGVAPVRFIPAGRLGVGPNREAGRAGTGAGNWSQNLRRYRAGDRISFDRENGWRIAQ